MLDINEIQKLLPHRYPFLFVDKVLELVVEKKVVGIKNISVNEPFFHGHFPGNPIMPGVNIIEACGQLAGLGMSRNDLPVKIEYLVGVQKFFFKKIVLPGDQLTMTAMHYKRFNQLMQVEVNASVLGQIVAEGVIILTASR